jgi:anti-sigma factor RsiW
MKNCKNISKGLLAYVDQRSNPAERRDVEEHLAGCPACRTRAEEFRALWKVMEEVPAVEPSLGFDARVRQRVAAEPSRGWFGWFAPQARLALSAAMLVALTVFIVKLPANHPQAPVAAPTVQTAVVASSDQDFDAVKDLGVLEDYDVVTDMDALSQLVPAKAPETQKPDSKQTESND